MLKDVLSERYNHFIFSYFYVAHNPYIFVARDDGAIVGAVIAKMKASKGYIAMLGVAIRYRRAKIGTLLVEKCIKKMKDDGANEVSLESEVRNTAAVRLYERLGFKKESYLERYYVNLEDAYRLVLTL